jgi:hypothetical protein
MWSNEQQHPAPQARALSELDVRDNNTHTPAEKALLQGASDANLVSLGL